MEIVLVVLVLLVLLVAVDAIARMPKAPRRWPQGRDQMLISTQKIIVDLTRRR